MSEACGLQQAVAGADHPLPDWLEGKAVRLHAGGGERQSSARGQVWAGLKARLVEAVWPKGGGAGGGN